MSDVLIELTHPDAKIPTRATEGSACFDVYAYEDADVEYGKVTIVDAGFRVHVPKGFELAVRPRSGLAFKHGITIVNTPGTIDSDYRGPVKIALTSINKAHCFSSWLDHERISSRTVVHTLRSTSFRFKIKKGDRIAQVALQKVPSWDFLEHKVEDNTSRGIGGIGSTGK